MTTLSRRGFLKGAVALGAGAVLYQLGGGRFKIVMAAGPVVRQLRLVHTNDHHARIEPVGVTIRAASGGNAAVTRNLGGVARRKTLFDTVRGDTAWATLPAFANDRLFLDAGDYFQGTLYFNQYLGKADRFFYNRLGYAASTFGNHEFDRGDQVLADFIAGVPIAQGQPAEPTAFPIIASNVTAGAASPLAALFQEQIDLTVANLNLANPVPIGKWGHRAVLTLPSGEKVGIVGLTTVETDNIAQPSDAISFNAEYANIVNAQAAILRGAPNNCNTVILLSHIGYQPDLVLAPQLTGVNIIVGAHSHTPLLPNSGGQPQPFGATAQGLYPTTLNGADAKPIIVVQDWEWGKWIGDLVVGFDADGLVSVISGTIQPVWADGLSTGGNPPRALIPGEGAEITPEASFQAAITSSFKPAIDQLSNTVIGTNTAALSNAEVRLKETALGNFLADAIRNQVSKFADNTPTIPLVAIYNGGGIRASLNEGPITVGEVLQIQPFGNTLGRVTVTGAQLKAALENGVSALTPGAALDTSRSPISNGRFPNVSGMRYTVDVRKPSAQVALPANGDVPAVPARPGQRIVKVEILEGDSYVPLDPAKIYRVAALSFLINGGDGYFAFTAGGDRADPSVGGATGQIDSGLIDADVVQDYIKAQPNATINPRTEGRITVIRQVTYLPFIGNGAPAAAPAAELVEAGD